MQSPERHACPYTKGKQCCAMRLLDEPVCVGSSCHAASAVDSDATHLNSAFFRVCRLTGEIHRHGSATALRGYGGTTSWEVRSTRAFEVVAAPCCPMPKLLLSRTSARLLAHRGRDGQRSAGTWCLSASESSADQTCRPRAARCLCSHGLVRAARRWRAGNACRAAMYGSGQV